MSSDSVVAALERSAQLAVNKRFSLIIAMIDKVCGYPSGTQTFNPAERLIVRKLNSNLFLVSDPNMQAAYLFDANGRPCQSKPQERA